MQAFGELGEPGGGVGVELPGEDAIADQADGGEEHPEDRGVDDGEAEAERQRIFEPFFSTKDSTGLGLSVCHSIVREHGGELVALAREGGGAVFRLTLPAAEAETEAA